MVCSRNKLTLVTVALATWTFGSLSQTLKAETAPALTLSEARATALRDNPSLRGAEAQNRASKGAARQAGSFLNPSIEFRREDFGSDSPIQEVAPQESFSLSQTVRTAGKRSALRDAARWASEAAKADYERQRLDLLAEVERRFAELLGAQERVRLSAENLGTAKEVASAVAALVEAGEVSPIENARAENDRELADIDLQNARQDEEVSRRQLASLLGQDQPGFGRAEGTLACDVALPDEAVALKSLGALPDLTRWDAEAHRLESSLLLAKRTPWPDLTFSVGVRKYTTTQERAYMAGIVIPLPLYDRNAGAVVEASALLDQGRLQRQAEAVRLHSSMTSARLVLEKAGAEVRTLKERVLPNAEQIFGAITEGYQRGKFRLMDLLEARRSLAGARLRYVDALVRLNTAKADMDRLLVTPPELTEGEKP
jgi:cobalt-zinc-cadmium efflux system outer membrane protein